MGRLVINGEEIYELDEECLKEKKRKELGEREGHRQENRTGRISPGYRAHDRRN